MTKLLKQLKGYKTYACALGLFLVYGAEGMGWLDTEIATVLKGLFGAGGMAALRAAKK